MYVTARKCTSAQKGWQVLQLLLLVGGRSLIGRSLLCFGENRFVPTWEFQPLHASDRLPPSIYSLQQIVPAPRTSVEGEEEAVWSSVADLCFQRSPWKLRQDPLVLLLMSSLCQDHVTSPLLQSTLVPACHTGGEESRPPRALLPPPPPPLLDDPPSFSLGALWRHLSLGKALCWQDAKESSAANYSPSHHLPPPPNHPTPTQARGA